MYLSNALLGYYHSLRHKDEYNGRPIQEVKDELLGIVKKDYPEITHEILKEVLYANVWCGDYCCWDGTFTDGKGEVGVVIDALGKEFNMAQ